MPKPIPYGRQFIDKDDEQAVLAALNHDFLTQGPKVAEFESAFADYVDAPFAVAVSNGTAALHLANIALGSKGKKVITTPITFAASANAILYAGGEPLLVDIDPNTALIDLNQVEDVLNKESSNIAGITPVNFAGLPVNTEELRCLADKHDAFIIEDACHSPGASFIDSKEKEIKSGSGIYSDATIFSFHPVKHIACGEGGMITTANEKLYQQLMRLRSHGITKDAEYLGEHVDEAWYYQMTELGYNYRLTDIQCALGLSQLKKADQGLIRRKEIASIYDKAFENVGLKHLINPTGFSNAYHLYVIEVENRKEVYDYLRANSIYAQIHYLPVHQLSYYKSLGYDSKAFPNANHYYERCISLPMFPTLKDEEQAFVIEKVLEVAK